MARRIFFSFHYERDAWRPGQVRNSNALAAEDRTGFIDSASDDPGAAQTRRRNPIRT